MSMVLYGPSGSGKTTIAASCPKPLLHIDINEKTSEVLKGMDGITTISVEEPEELEDIYWWIHDHPEKFRSGVIDSIGQYQDQLINTKSAGGTRALTKRDWGDISGKMKAQITRFTKLEMNIVFIAHDRVFTMGTEEDESGLPGQVITLPEVGPSVIPSVSKVLNATVGILGNTFIMETMVKKKRKVGGKIVVRRERLVEYCVRLGPHSVYRSKVRKPLGIEVPPYIVNPTFEKFQQVIGGTYGKVNEKSNP